MDTEIFNAFAEWFVSATAEVRSRHRNIVLTLDGYGAHKSVKALQFLKKNNIVVTALPAHTIYRTQVLDYSIFSPFKTYLRNALNINAHPSEDAAFKAFQQLTESFTRSRNLLRSDGPVAENGRLNTKAGALLTSQNVLDYLESRAKANATAAAEKAARETAALQRRSERGTEADERARARRDAEEARISHVTWMSLRGARARGLMNSRGQRRVLARQRALRTKGIQSQI